MRVLIFHGYLLRGTGSNIYNANLARALGGLGHEVHLLCQDLDADRSEWVDAVGRWDGGGLEVERLREPSGAGSLTAYLPEIGGLLPLYVHDSYEGFQARVFAELTDVELERYVEANVSAVRDVAAAAGRIDAALANHLVMGPAILARSGLRFAAKVHGSALEYTVKPDLERFGPYAREGVEAAAAILVGSRHTAESLWAALPGIGLEARTRLGPPGVDVRRFRPLSGVEAEKAPAALEARAQEIEAEPGEGAFGRDPALADRAIREYAGAAGPRVIFVGKLIVSKGVDLLLAGWPLVHAENPGARLLIAGFGEFDAGLRRLFGALAAGDLDGARQVARLGRGLEGGEAAPLPILSAFLADPGGEYLAAAAAAAGSVSFAGRVEHDEVAELIPLAEALVMPSTFPEAFGMVAVEAAACGVLPVSAAHSGMQEVSRQLAPALPAEVAPLISFPVTEGAVEGIAARLNAWLGLDADTREQAREALVRTTRDLWSWEGVARGVIAASEGRLEELPEP